MNSPFPYFGGKRTVAAAVWARLGSPAQYIEPFCGSLAVLLACPRPAALEVVCDGSGFIAFLLFGRMHRPVAPILAMGAGLPYKSLIMKAYAS